MSLSKKSCVSCFGWILISSTIFRLVYLILNFAMISAILQMVKLIITHKGFFTLVMLKDVLSHRLDINKMMVVNPQLKIRIHDTFFVVRMIHLLNKFYCIISNLLLLLSYDVLFVVGQCKNSHFAVLPIRTCANNVRQ